MQPFLFLNSKISPETPLTPQNPHTFVFFLKPLNTMAIAIAILGALKLKELDVSEKRELDLLDKFVYMGFLVAIVTCMVIAGGRHKAKVEAAHFKELYSAELAKNVKNQAHLAACSGDGYFDLSLFEEVEEPESATTDNLEVP